MGELCPNSVLIVSAFLQKCKDCQSKFVELSRIFLTYTTKLYTYPVAQTGEYGSIDHLAHKWVTMYSETL